MPPVQPRVDHEVHTDQNDAVQVLGMLRSLDAKVEELRSLLAQRRKEMNTVEEFSQIVGRSAYTVRRWVAEGKVQAIRVEAGGPRGRLLIPRSELVRLIEAGKGDLIPESAVDK